MLPSSALVTVADRTDNCHGRAAAPTTVSGMAEAEVDDYLSRLDQSCRDTLQEMRHRILRVIPDAEQGLSYGLPVFRVQGKPLAGLAAFRNHLSYLPHSGSVLTALGERLSGYIATQGSLHFAVGRPLPQDLIGALLQARMVQTGLT